MSKLEDKNYKQKMSIKSLKTKIEIPTDPRLALSCFEQCAVHYL